jgi:hypothetical protein
MEALKFAVVKDNVCINVINAVSLEDAEFHSGEKCYLILNPPIIDPNVLMNSEIFAKLQASCVGIGWTYSPNINKFIPPQPYPSWILNDDNLWFAPIEQPHKQGYFYTWNEDTISWDENLEPNWAGSQ